MLFNRIKVLCKEHNTNPTALCKHITDSSGNLPTWKKGNIKPQHLQKIADYFDVSIDYLLGRTEIPNIYKNIVNTHIKNKPADFISTDLPPAIAERMRSHNLSLERFKNLTPQQTDDLLNIIEIFLNNLK